jgi:hypothetical protein
MTPIDATNNASTVQETASVSMLKKTLDTQQSQMQQLMKSLPTVQDTARGQNVDFYA